MRFPRNSSYSNDLWRVICIGGGGRTRLACLSICLCVVNVTVDQRPILINSTMMRKHNTRTVATLITCCCCWWWWWWWWWRVTGKRRRLPVSQLPERIVNVSGDRSSLAAADSFVRSRQGQEVYYYNALGILQCCEMYSTWWYCIKSITKCLKFLLSTSKGMLFSPKKILEQK